MISTCDLFTEREVTAGVDAAAIWEITKEGARDIWADVTCGVGTWVTLIDWARELYCDGATTDWERETKPGETTSGAPEDWALDSLTDDATAWDTARDAKAAVAALDGFFEAACDGAATDWTREMITCDGEINDGCCTDVATRDDLTDWAAGEAGWEEKFDSGNDANCDANWEANCDGATTGTIDAARDPLFEIWICWDLAICDAVIDGTRDIVPANEVALDKACWDGTNEVFLETEDDGARDAFIDWLIEAALEAIADANWEALADCTSWEAADTEEETTLEDAGVEILVNDEAEAEAAIDGTLEAFIEADPEMEAETDEAGTDAEPETEPEAT